MFPFWESVVEPAIAASGATPHRRDRRRAGETTVRSARRARPRHRAARDRPGPGVRSRPSTTGGSPAATSSTATSASTCCPTLAAFDVALVDGDHNWYTVYNELRHARATPRATRGRAAAVADPARRRLAVRPPRPLLRARARSPRSSASRTTRRGMRPEREQLLPQRRHEPCTLDNAVDEGGPRNGVMTALDDFVAEHDEPLRRLVLPIYFGLAIVAEEDAPRRPARARRLLDRFESDRRQGTTCSSWPSRSASTRPCSSTTTDARCATSTRTAARPLPRPARGRAARRALPRERGPDRVPAGVHRAGEAPHAPTISRDPGLATCARSAWRAAQRGSSGSPTRTATSPPTSRTPTMGGLKLDHLDARAAHRSATRRSPAISWSAAPGRGGAGVVHAGLRRG